MESQAKIDKELTFRPRINKSSSVVSPRFTHKTEDLLIKSAIQKRENIDDLANLKQKELMKECTFRPSVNPLSEVIDQSKNRLSSRHEKLYDEAKVRNEKFSKDAERVEDYPFKPQLVSKQCSLDDQTREACMQRLLYSKERFNRVIEETRKKQEEPIDEKTGQTFFKPIIGRGPESPRLTSVWDHLFSLQKQSSSTLQTSDHWRSLTEFPKTTELTEKIYQDFKLKRFMRIFSILDSDQDGLISESQADWKNTDPKICEMIKGIIAKLDQKELKFSVFVQKFDPLVMRMSVEERARILKRDEESKDREDLRINQSHQIISRNSNLN